MAAIGVSSIIVIAGLVLAFLIAPRLDGYVLADAGLVLVALGFVGLLAAAVVGATATHPPPPPPRDRGRGPRPY